MAFVVTEKVVDGVEAFEIVVFDPPLTKVGTNLYEAFEHFEVDYVGSNRSVVRIENKKSNILVLENEVNEGLGEKRKRLTIEAVFVSKVIRR